MDATRPRRSRDCTRQRWYAYWRALRFARHLGFAPAAPHGDGPDLKGDEDVGLFTWLFGKKEAAPVQREQGVSPSEGNNRAQHVPASKTDNGAQHVPPSEADNVKRWRESGQARAWVEAHNGQWNHADWLALLEELKRSAFWPMQLDAVGLALEDAKRDWLRRN